MVDDAQIKIVKQKYDIGLKSISFDWAYQYSGHATEGFISQETISTNSFIFIATYGNNLRFARIKNNANSDLLLLSGNNNYIRLVGMAIVNEHSIMCIVYNNTYTYLFEIDFTT